jgi:hypothetical protein
LLVGSVVIDAEFDMEDHSSIHHNYDWEGLEPFYVKTDPQTILKWWWKKKKKN